MSRVLSLLAALCLASPVWAQDPVKADPAHHKVVLENSDVRVLRITFGPHEKAPAHDHPASVAVFMTDVQNRVTPAGGKPNETPRKRGGTVALAAGKHTVENLGATPSEVVLVELKTPAGTGAWAGVKSDAVKLDPTRYKVEFENDRARVLRITYGPKEKSVMHDHPATIVVFLTDANFTFTAPGATPPRPPTGKAGDVGWGEAETHLPENVSDEPFEAILVELKTRAAKGTSAH